MQKFILSVVGAAAAVAATPALAADSYTSFTGVNGAGGFIYGSTDGTTLTPFTTNGGCALNGNTICLHSTTDNLPQASIRGAYPTVAVPAAEVLLHPGNSDSFSVYSAYAPTSTGLYSYTINVQSVGYDTTNGVGYTPFTSIGGVVTQGQRNVLATYGSTGILTGTQVLTPGSSFGVIIDRNGYYGGDSTGLSFSVSAVPEPATWAMMVIGFGMVGFGIRYRRRSTKVRSPENRAGRRDKGQPVRIGVSGAYNRYAPPRIEKRLKGPCLMSGSAVMGRIGR